MPHFDNYDRSHNCPVPWIRTEQDSMGVWSTDPFCVPCFLIVGYRLYSASLTLPEFQRTDPNSCWSEKGRDTKTGEKQSNGGTALGQDPGSYSRNTHNSIFGSFYRTGAPTQVGDERWAQRFLEHQPVASLHPAALPSNLPSFSGTSDQYPVRFLVWPLSISPPTGSNSFSLNHCYYKNGSQFQIQNASI